MNAEHPRILGGESDPRAGHDQLSTDHLRPEIRNRTISGGVASAASQATQLVLTLGYNVVLARLLSPHEFGLVALATTVAGFLQVFKEAGLPTATIQRDNVTQAQVTNLFWMNVAVSSTAAMVMAASAPLVARFFREPELVPVSLALSLAFVLEGLAAQHLALLNRQMRFPVIALINVGCGAAGFAVGVILAATGWSYWSLVGATLSTAAFRAIAIWLSSGWRPHLPTRHSGVRPLVRFGLDLTLVGVVHAVTRGCDSILIGRYLGTEAVGVYSRATVLLTRPIEGLTAPIFAVIVPALSRLQGEPQRYRRAFLRTFEALAIGGCIFTGLFLPLAEPVVLVVLGEKWAGVAPIFAALSVSALHVPASTATSWLYTSQGRGRELLLTASLAGIVMVLALGVGTLFGPVGVAVAYSASGVLAALPMTFTIAGRRGPVSAGDLWSAYARHMPVLLVVLAATWGSVIASAHVLSPIQQLAVCVPAGLLAASVAVLIFPTTRVVASEFLGVWMGGGTHRSGEK